MVYFIAEYCLVYDGLFAKPQCSVDQVVGTISQVDLCASEDIIGRVVVNPCEAHFGFTWETTRNRLGVIRGVVVAGGNELISGEQYGWVQAFGKLVAIFKVTELGQRGDFFAVSNDLNTRIATAIVHVMKDRHRL